MVLLRPRSEGLFVKPVEKRLISRLSAILAVWRVGRPTLAVLLPTCRTLAHVTFGASSTSVLGRTRTVTRASQPSWRRRRRGSCAAPSERRRVLSRGAHGAQPRRHSEGLRRRPHHPRRRAGQRRAAGYTFHLGSTSRPGTCFIEIVLCHRPTREHRRTHQTANT